MSKPQSSTNLPRVFVPIRTDRYDISQAGKFGEIIYLSDENISPFNINEVVWKFINSLRNNFNPEVDYICMTGNSLILCWLSTAISILYPKVKILLYDSRSEDYQVREFEVPKIGAW